MIADAITPPLRHAFISILIIFISPFYILAIIDTPLLTLHILITPLMLAIRLR
jgi:hypothetical protein